MEKIVRKIIIIVLFLTTITFVSIKSYYVKANKECCLNSKFIFEGYDLHQDSSLDEINKEILLDDNDVVKIQLVLDYNDFPDIKYKSEIHENDVDEFIRDNRIKSKDFHSKKNNEFVNNLNTIDYKRIYVSTYSPFINLEIDKSTFLSNYEIYSLYVENHPEIKCAYIQNYMDNYENNFDTAIETGNLTDIIDIGEITGKEVVVGVLEAGGIIDKNHENIAGSSFTIRNEWYYNETVSEHATQVASIIGGNFGIARGAHILSVELYGDPVSEVDWMLDRNVNIINMSYSEKTPNGKYSSSSAHMDYISRNHWVTFVGAAGNEGNGTSFVGNPGLGYNVLTVGATNMNGTTLASYSSYKVVVGPHKPSLVAPSGFTIPNYSSLSFGTSFSAPYVTGAIALLMEKSPALKTNPERVHSILAASSNPINNYNDRLSSGLNNKVGAGLIDYERAESAISTSNSISNISGSSKSVRFTKTVYISSGSRIKVALFWLLNSNKGTNIEITDYDLRLQNSSGTTLKAASSINNLEIIEYTVSTSGYYTIVVYQYSSKKTTETDWLSLTYTIR